jgi:SAM-dependent methyltransferase
MQQNLPLGDGEVFDVVVCQQGLQFMQDKVAAVREMRLALAPGGRVALSTWRAIQEVPFIHELHRIAERHLGPVHDVRHSFGDAAELERVMHEGGFRNVEMKRPARTICFADGSVLVRMNAMALVGMSPKSKEIAEDDRRRIVEEIVADSADMLESYREGSGIAFDLTTNLTTASV